MAVPNGDKYRRIWLLLARGGEWSPKRVVRALHYEIPYEHVYNLLWCMAKRHDLLHRTVGERRQVTYSVRPDCIVPRGTTLQDLLKAIDK